MTWAEMRSKLDALCSERGLDPATVEVEMEPPEPSAPVRCVGVVRAFDGRVSLLVSGIDYEWETQG